MCWLTTRVVQYPEENTSSEREGSLQVHKSVFCILGIEERSWKNASSRTVRSVKCAFFK